MSFWRTPNQLKLAGMSKLATHSRASWSRVLWATAICYHQTPSLGLEEQALPGRDSREAVPAHSSCCRWRLPLLSRFLRVLRARQGLGAGGRGAAGVWGGRLGAAAALPCSAHSSKQNSCLSCLSSPIFLCSNEEQSCFTLTQLIPECTATEAPPAALQP